MMMSENINEYTASQADETGMDVVATVPGEENFVPRAAGILGEDGSFISEWYSHFDELKGTERSLSRFKTPEALAKSYTELERLRRYPGVENEELMSRFRHMAGLPATAEEYRLERPESTSEEEWNPVLAERMASTAYHYGVPPEAMNALQETMFQASQEAREQAVNRSREEEIRAETSLQEEWGGNYERNMASAASALQRLAAETGVNADDLMDNPALGSNPDIIRLLHHAARLMDEAPLHHSGQGTPSPAEEAMRIESDPSHPLHDAYMSVNHPNHRYANDLYDRLTSRN